MTFSLTDTITALATPPGTSALCIIRVSGSKAIQNVTSVFSSPQRLLSAEDHQAVHGYIRDGKRSVDEVVCLVYRHPHSFTGEDMVEISGHGNPDLANQILRLLLTSCRLAEPGEFTFRAFMNHKLDLAQAEAVNDLISAQTAKAEKSALNQLQGRLSEQIRYYVDALTECRICFELAIDFADQDLPEMDLSLTQSRLQDIRSQLDIILRNGRQGRILRDGYTVCLAGAPNVGKSSLFNLFLQTNRALVTPTPGTTRDYLEEWLSLDGFPIRLIDTAGLRETPDGIEQMGMDKTREQLAKADLILYLTDPDTIGTDPLLADYLTDPRVLPVLNKTDLLGITELTDWQAAIQEKLPVTDDKLLKTLIPLSTFFAETLIPLQTAILQRIA